MQDLMQQHRVFMISSLGHYQDVLQMFDLGHRKTKNEQKGGNNEQVLVEQIRKN